MTPLRSYNTLEWKSSEQEKRRGKKRIASWERASRRSLVGRMWKRKEFFPMKPTFCIHHKLSCPVNFVIGDKTEKRIETRRIWLRIYFLYHWKFYSNSKMDTNEPTGEKDFQWNLFFQSCEFDIENLIGVLWLVLNEKIDWKWRKRVDGFEKYWCCSVLNFLTIGETIVLRF